MFDKRFDIRNASRNIAFKGFTHIEPIADKQTGPTCGFEAIENIIQLFYKDTPNNLSETDLLPWAKTHQVQVGNDKQELAVDVSEHPERPAYVLNHLGYIPILAKYGISAQRYEFNHLQVIIPALQQNKGILLIGDAHCLNPAAYRPNSYHAFILTNYFVDESETNILGYVGIDSNFANKETSWYCQNVEDAAAVAAQRITKLPVLITDMPGNWPSTAKYYRLLQSGKFEPVY
jgi:hypothetical protein